ncbi:MAG: ATP-binding cassette domain-containing protein [Chloroflexi bacterium]|nr:ATP-binding cassette domain-containing protein [Chloroflexota bacterium]
MVAQLEWARTSRRPYADTTNQFGIRSNVGETIALFGPSGAGKTTVAHLLLRFDEPTRGAIFIDDVPLRELDADAWRSQLAYVPQAPHLFHASIADNLFFARPAATPAEMERAARDAHLHAWGMTLPERYNTVIGEDAARLSGGQAQRLALARAFLKDAPILILDEPTSNVDPELEAQLRDAVTRLMCGRTTLLIAHRLAALYRADNIVVIQNGRVVETGNHQMLLQRGGVYQKLALGAGMAHA